MFIDKEKLGQLVKHADQTLPPGKLASKLIPLLDLTNLNEGASQEDIAQLCAAAQTDLGPTAAICIEAKFLELARQLLKNTTIKLATVVNFPSGNAPLPETLAEIATAINNGAHEIDLVMPYQDFLAGKRPQVASYIEACHRECGETVLLKVILETGALDNTETIYEAARLAIDAGAGFIKTSTGKIRVGASLEAAACMLLAIKDSGRNVGFKAAGGVRTPAQAAAYLSLVENILGLDCVVPERLRIGASSLLQELLG
ncbi:MAG: deoxyribose-phosphate aldolase [Oligoflexus sp.]